MLYRTASLSAPHEVAAAMLVVLSLLGCIAPILRGRSDLADVLPLVAGEDSWTLKPGGFDALRKHDFDVALCAHPPRRYPDLLQASALGIPNRVGYNYKGLTGLMTTPIGFDYPSPFPSYFRTMVSHIASVPGDWKLRPTIPLGHFDIELAESFLIGLQLDGALSRRLLSRNAAARWSVASGADARGGRDSGKVDRGAGGSLRRAGRWANARVVGAASDGALRRHRWQAAAQEFRSFPFTVRSRSRAGLGATAPR